MPRKGHNQQPTVPSHLLTREGYRSLKTRQRSLRTARMETLAEIRHLREEQASEPLDLAHTFKQLQQIENEMARIDAVLMHANICQQGERDVACIGAKVTLASAGQQLVIVLVDSIEANPLDGYISVESPLGKEVVGKRPRTQLQVQTIKGLCVYEILAIN